MKHQVTISNHALEEMVLAASESFVLGNAAMDGSVEIHGYLWGGRRTDDKVEYIHIDKFSVSTSALGDENSIMVDKDVVRIKDSILRLWAPYYHFLGDFHTHPYRDYDEVKKCEGWNFSKGDKKTFRDDDIAWSLCGSNKPIMMVMAVTEMGTVHNSSLEIQRGNSVFKVGESKKPYDEVLGRMGGNRLVFNVGNLRFWLSVGIGRKTRQEKRMFDEGRVCFDPLSRYFNKSSSKLEGVKKDD